MKVLVVDIGGTNVKILATCKRTLRQFSSGATMARRQTVSTVRKIAREEVRHHLYRLPPSGCPWRACQRTI